MEQCKALLSLQEVELKQAKEQRAAVVVGLAREAQAWKWLEDLTVVEAGLKVTAELLESRTWQLIQLEKETKSRQEALENERKALNSFQSDLVQQAQRLKRQEYAFQLAQETAEQLRIDSNRKDIESFCRDLVQSSAVEALCLVKQGEISTVTAKKRQIEELIEGLGREVALCVGIKARLGRATGLIWAQSQGLKPKSDFSVSVDVHKKQDRGLRREKGKQQGQNRLLETNRLGK